jgi:AraC-like DNA-binding protein
MERLNAVKSDTADKKRPETASGCPWYIASREHHCCFWVFAESLEESIPDKEICALLGISKTTLEKSFASAIEKLKMLKDTEVIKDLRMMVAERLASQPHDYTTFIPDEFRDMLKKVTQSSDNGAIMDEANRETDKKPKKHPTGLPLHRDGRKVDLFGLYSRKNKARQRTPPPIPPEKEEKKEKKDDKDK